MYKKYIQVNAYVSNYVHMYTCIRLYTLLQMLLTAIEMQVREEDLSPTKA